MVILMSTDGTDDDRLALLDELIRLLDFPITDDDRGRIQQALILIQGQVEQHGYVKFAEGYQHGHTRGELDTLKELQAPTATQPTPDELLEQLAQDLHAGRAHTH